MSLPLSPERPKSERPCYRRPAATLLGAPLEHPDRELACALSLKLGDVLHAEPEIGDKVEEQSPSEVSTRCSSSFSSRTGSMTGPLPAIDSVGHGTLTPRTSYARADSQLSTGSEPHSPSSSKPKAGFARLRQMRIAMAARCELAKSQETVHNESCWHTVMVPPSQRESIKRQETVRRFAREMLRARRGSKEELDWQYKLEQAKIAA